MKIKKRILESLKIAETNKFERMEKTLTVVLDLIKHHNMKSDDEILDMLEDMIIKTGNDIVKYMENGNTKKMESNMFAQNIYNEYISEFKCGGKHRPIYYERELQGIINSKFSSDDNAITFKVKLQKK